MSKKPKLLTPETGQRGMSALHFAAYSGDLAVLQDELRNCNDVNITDDDGRTPLHWLCDMSAAIESPLSCFNALIKAGANINAQMTDGTTPLMLACLAGSDEIAIALLKAGADPNLRSDQSTALHDAAMSPKVTRLLLEYGSLLTERNSRNMFPLEHARSVECAESVKTIEEFKKARYLSIS